MRNSTNKLALDSSAQVAQSWIVHKERSNVHYYNALLKMAAHERFWNIKIQFLFAKQNQSGGIWYKRKYDGNLH